MAPTPPRHSDFHHANIQHPAKVWVIAEIGVNHDGSVARATELIHAAAKAGAHAVKFQLFRPDRLLSAQAQLAQYQKSQTSPTPPQNPRSLLAKLTLTPDDLQPLRDATQAAGMAFVVTPFSLEDVADLKSLDIDAVKIASPDAVNLPLLEATAQLNKPLWISTGTCDLNELDAAAKLVQQTNGALFQCVSAYPTPDASAALGGVIALKNRFPELRIGYSDHTADQDTGALAVAAGACVLEKHLTHDPTAPGPDHAVSLDPAALGHYIAAAKRAAVRLGPLTKICQPLETDVRKVSRQSLCLTRDLPAGHRLTPADLTIKRPGTGLPAAALTATLGRTLKRAVTRDNLLHEADLAPQT
ncbi:MAG: N-acetylneuraminate synthase family protein [Algisphaera sp.]